ncbi:hypothetical protein SANTM175S_00217 [Streptomyces antimycoticus]
MKRWTWRSRARPSWCGTTPRSGGSRRRTRGEYGEEWTFQARDGAFHHDGHALVSGSPRPLAFGFRKGAYGQTRWRF